MLYNKYTSETIGIFFAPFFKDAFKKRYKRIIHLFRVFITFRFD